MDFQSAKSFGAFQPYHQILYTLTLLTLGISISNAFNAIYVNTVDTNDIHICAHNFLNFQWIFNPRKVLESWDWGLFNHIINTIYVHTVDTRQGSLMHSMLSMLTLLIQFSHLTVLCIRCCVRATYTSVDSVDKHSIKCIACFDLHIDSVDKQDTLLNTQ